MDEHQTDPPMSPPLWLHRLLPSETGDGTAAGQPAEGVEPTGASWFAASLEASSPVLAPEGRALAEQTWLLIEHMTPTLAALPALLQRADAPEKAFARVEVLGSLLLALPQQMASGLEASLARVDGLFAQLLNAPGRPGAIEQVMDALAVLSLADELRAEQETQLEGLRALHRELVTLHQAWEAVREASFLDEFPLLAIRGVAHDRQGEPVGAAAASLPSAPPPQAATPLQAGGVVVQPAVGSFRLRRGRQHQQRLVLGLVALVLVIAGIGVHLLQSRGAPALQAKATASSATQFPSSAETATPPIQRQPTTTAATPTPRLPTPGPQPTTLAGWLCPPGSVLCVSTLQVDLPCSGDGRGSFQLLNTSAGRAKWHASITPGPGGTHMAISPAAGNLKPADIATLTVYTNEQGQPLLGTISIVDPDGTAPITVAVYGCGA